MSLEDVANVTKITRTTLAHLEAGSAERLPATVYVRGFVRSVAGVVGLDAAELLRQLDAPEGAGEVVATERSRGRRHSDTLAPLGGLDERAMAPALRSGHVLMAVVALGMLLAAWFTVGSKVAPGTTGLGGHTATPAIQDRVDGVSAFTATDTTRD